MATKEEAIAQAVKLSGNAVNIITNITHLERQAQNMLFSGEKRDRIAPLNGKINQFVGDAADMIMRAKITIEKAQEMLRKEIEEDAQKGINPGTHPNVTTLKLLKQKMNYLDKQSDNICQVHQRVLSRMKPLNTDPMFERVKSLPKAPTTDPEAVTKVDNLIATMDNLIATMFDTNGILNDDSIQSARRQLNDNEKALFINALAKRILQDGHAHLNAVKALAQLSKPNSLDVYYELLVQLQKESKDNNEKTIAYLNSLKPHDAALPITQQPKPPDPKSDEEEKFKSKLKEAVDGDFDRFKEMLKDMPKAEQDKFQIAYAVEKGFDTFKKMMKDMPKEDRYNFLIGYKEGREAKKVEQMFEKAKTPQEEPSRPHQ